MIKKLNISLFLSINQYTGLDQLLNNITLIVARYIPLLFFICLIYLWIKKGDKYKDIVLYSVYASILGLTINFVMEFLFSNSVETFSDPVTFMLSVALMMTYFRETRKIGMILLVLGLTGAFMSIYIMYIPLYILGSTGVAIISTISIYSIKEKLVSLNQIFKLIYLILK